MTRNLILILGDQLNIDATAFDGFDPVEDFIFMAEVHEESTHVWSSKARIAVFLSGMRHFRERLLERNWPLRYRYLHDPENRGTLRDELTSAMLELAPQKLIMTAPGDYRVLMSLREVARQNGLTLDVRDDLHFLTTVRDFASFSKGRKELRMEYWYRQLRRRDGILMEGDQPIGNQWNYDQDNRKSFGKSGPTGVVSPLSFKPDAITREVIDLVSGHFSDHPGSLNHFDWPVTPEDAERALDDFIEHRLPFFGPHEDAMWTGEPWLFHSRLSMALNLKLLSPRSVIDRVEQAYTHGKVPLESAEGFIRQVLGWREYVRGIYWTRMPDYLDLNALNATADLPSFFWNGETPLRCLSHCLRQSLDYGYAHHIQRLMVIGLYALLYGVHPKAVHQWFLAVYVDAVEWVELPNTLGMSQYGDGGILGSKPYIATGQYIHRMSNYCVGCVYDPGQRLGPKACPFTTMYWDFLIRHRERLSKNPRMSLQVRNLNRLSQEDVAAIESAADQHRLHQQCRNE
jgi:deoxyribodipyrimidine photolyase-related protein